MLISSFLLQSKSGEGDFSHTWAPSALLSPSVWQALKPTSLRVGYFIREERGFPPCTLRLIHVPRSIPSQLRSFHVNGVFIAPVHWLWKRGLLWYKHGAELPAWQYKSCYSHSSFCLSLSAFAYISTWNSVSLPRSLSLLMSYGGLLE